LQVADLGVVPEAQVSAEQAHGGDELAGVQDRVDFALHVEPNRPADHQLQENDAQAEHVVAPHLVVGQRLGIGDQLLRWALLGCVYERLLLVVGRSVGQDLAGPKVDQLQVSDRLLACVLVHEDVFRLYVSVHDPQCTEELQGVKNAAQEVFEEIVVETHVALQLLVLQGLAAGAFRESAFDFERARVHGRASQLESDPEVLAVRLVLEHLTDVLPALLYQRREWVDFHEFGLHFLHLLVHLHLVAGHFDVVQPRRGVVARGLLQRDLAALPDSQKHHRKAAFAEQPYFLEFAAGIPVCVNFKIFVKSELVRELLLLFGFFLARFY